MDFITREQARRDIVALGLPPILLDAFDEKPLPYGLDFQFREPYEIFCLDAEQQAPYGKGRITPIWTDSTGYWIAAYHHAPERAGFFRFDLESPGEEKLPVALSWQQILVAEFIFLREMETPEDQLREIARWFGFRYIDALIAELSRGNADTHARAARYGAFLEKTGIE